MGSLESWLLLRSLKTLHLRVPRQSETATALAQWLKNISKTPKSQFFEGIPGGLVTNVWHSSLQAPDARGFDPKNQMTGGFNATFSIEVGSCFFLGMGYSCTLVLGRFQTPRLRSDFHMH
jgi:cystathionine gamma-synthase